MATVYLAHDLKHDRKVAVKVLRPELAAILGGERFLQRDQGHRQPPAPQHPPALRLGRGRHVPLLRDAVRGGRVAAGQDGPREAAAVEEAVEIARKGVAARCSTPTSRAIVHRDIKPENILLQRGQPLVADFGIALAVSARGRAAADGDRPLARHTALHEPRAGDGRPGARRPERHLLAGGHGLRDARRRAAPPRQHGPGDHRQDPLRTAEPIRQSRDMRAGQRGRHGAARRSPRVRPIALPGLRTSPPH